jgi:large repetitive protein
MVKKIEDAEEIEDAAGALLINPTITSPKPGTTVPMTGFFIKAVGVPQLLGGWQVEIWGSRELKYSAPGGISLKLWIPGTEIYGNFNIRVRYYLFPLWSGWQESRNLYKPTWMETLPPPGITSPGELDITDQPLTIRGTCVSGATDVSVFFREPNAPYQNAQITGTHWSLTPSEPLPSGKVSFQAAQFRLVNGNNEASPSSALRTIQVRPPIPTINLPLENNSISITSYFSGTGYPNAEVRIVQHGYPAQVLGRGTVSNNGTWRALVNLDPARFPPGTYEFSAQQLLDNLESHWLNPPRKVQVQQYLPMTPSIVIPGENTYIYQNKEFMGIAYGINVTNVWMKSTSIGDIWDAEAYIRPEDRVWFLTRLHKPGFKTIQARQMDSGVMSDWTEPREFWVRPPQLTIKQPTETVGPYTTFEVTGVYSGADLRMRWSGVDSAFISGSFSTNGTISIFTPSEPWDIGERKIVVVQYVDTVDSLPSNICIFYVWSRPTVREPGSGVVTSLKPRIWGNCKPGAKITLLCNGSPDVRGSVREDNGTWTYTATMDWPAGEMEVVVEQSVNNGPAEDSLPRKFFTAPSELVVLSPEKGGRVVENTISGACKSGVVIEVFSQGGYYGKANVTGTNWDFSYPWQIGEVLITLRQHTPPWPAADTVSINLDFVAPPSKPVITPPSNPATARQLLEITNVYSRTVTLKMLTEAGPEVPGTFSTSGTTRTFTPTADWSPGPNTVKVVQTVSGVPSDSSELCTVTVKPSIPTITNPLNNTSHLASLRVSGTCMAGATVAVKNGDDSPFPPVTVIVNGTTWHFDYPWLPGPKEIKVVQTLNGQPSDLSVLCEFSIKPPKPVITPPPNPADAKQVLEITNVYSGTVTLKMLTEAGPEVPGTFSTTGATRTFTPTANWALGPNKVKVVQTVNGVPSDSSELCTVTVKPPRPAITGPATPTPPRPTFSGTGYEGATINVVQQSHATPVLATAIVRGRVWEATLKPDITDLPAGPYPLSAQQIVGGVPSDWMQTFEIKVQPPKPAITPPPNPAAAKQALTITGVSSGTVTLKMLNGVEAPIDGDFTENGTTRTFTPTADWASGDNTVKVVQTVNGVDSDPSDECTFTVEAGEKPDAPQFNLPPAGFKTPTRPTIRVIGLPHALMTVRLEGSETLHSDTADADGVLEFAVSTPLVPGQNALEVKQKGDGPESGWSEPHRFTVKEPPKTPEIDVPAAGGNTARKPTIRGTGETRGQILLRHEDDPENLIDTIKGVTRWRWDAQEPWDVGTYTIQVRQTEDGDSSSWSEPRTFIVADPRYGIGDAGPVLAQPVVSNNESVLLRVQVVSGETGEAVEGVKVEWRIVGEQAVKMITVTDPDGWTRYFYMPGTEGKHTVLADLTNENQGVAITQRFEVTALADDAWAQELELYLAGEKVDLANGNLALLRGKSYELELKVNSGSSLIGSSVTLDDLSEAEALGLRFVPPLGAPQTLEEGQSVQWSITSEPGKSGYFGLKLTSPKLADWQLPGRVIAQDLSEEVDVHFDTFAKVFGGDPAYPCLGATHTVTVRPKAHSLLLGKDVIVEVTEEAAGLGVVVSPQPNIPQKLGEDGVSWTFNCVNSTQSGNFSVRLRVLEWDLSSSELPMSLGDNKVKVIDRDGPREIGGGNGSWRTGVCVASEFTGKVVAVPVTVHITGKEPSVRSTDSSGWIYIYHGSDESVSFTFHNRYDGSTA